MNLTTKARYAVMAMADINAQNAFANQKASLVSACSIAKRQNISQQYLEQILNILKNKGLIKSVKGSQGGYYLAKSAEEIKLFDIISATSEKTKMTRCSKDDFCTIGAHSACITHNLWSGLSYHIEQYFKKISLVDLAKNNNQDFYQNLFVKEGA